MKGKKENSGYFINFKNQFLLNLWSEFDSDSLGYENYFI